MKALIKQFAKQLLIEAGLVLKEKKHSAMFDSTSSFGNGRMWNQIWVRR